MFKRFTVPRFFSLLTISLALLLATPAHAQVVFVFGGDDAGLAAAIAALPPGGTVVIDYSGIFYAPVTLGPADSEKKIMAAPGIVAAFDGTFTPPGTSGFTIAGAQNVVLENLKITAYSASGVRLIGPNSSAKLINLQITMSGTAGVHAEGGTIAEIEGSRILNNTIGVYLENTPQLGAAATIEKTQVRNNRTVGVLFRGQGRGKAKIWHSMIDKNGAGGVRVAPASYMVVNNTDVAFNGTPGVASSGVFFEPGSLGSLSFNTIVHNTGAGISAVGATVNVTPGNNTVANNAPNAVGLALPATNQVGP